MDSRRLVVWISTGILVFQGAALVVDLLNCTALSWLSVRVNGLQAMERRLGEGRAVAPDGPRRPSGGSLPEPPAALFCSQPQGRIDAAVNQGLSVLTGLALGSSVNSRAQ